MFLNYGKRTFKFDSAAAINLLKLIVTNPMYALKMETEKVTFYGYLVRHH
jgi:hypothetical protein